MAASPTPVLFLDFDGVLNHRAHFASLRPGRVMADCLDDDQSFDRAAVARVNAICERSGARVVVSSSWRTYPGEPGELAFPLPVLRQLLARHGFTDEVIDVTPRLHRTAEGKGAARGDEIQAWLDQHPNVTSFAILDDVSDMAHLADHLVQTSFDTGLLDEHVEAAVRLLTRA